MRFMGTCGATIGLLVLTGCGGNASSHGCRCSRTLDADWRVLPSPHLLFDRAAGSPLQPGDRPITAEDFAFRSGWPSTSTYYSGGEVVFYRERYSDYQGDGFTNFNHVRRHRESYRVGAAFR